PPVAPGPHGRASGGAPERGPLGVALGMHLFTTVNHVRLRRFVFALPTLPTATRDYRPPRHRSRLERPGRDSLASTGKYPGSVPAYTGPGGHTAGAKSAIHAAPAGPGLPPQSSGRSALDPC